MNDTPSWPAGAGEMAGRIRTLDWTSTPLGPVERWPQSLRTAVEIMLATPVPASVMWGPALVQLYNDPYVAVAQDRHPALLGRGALEGWADARGFLGPVLEGILAGGPFAVLRDQRIALRRSDGGEEERVFTATFSTVPDESGAVGGVFHLLQETTATERAVRELGASEERHRLIVENARDYAILTTDPEGRIESWSPGAEAVFGWSEAEVVGREVDITFTPEDRSSGEPEKERATARRDGFAPDVRWHQRKDGSRIFIEGVSRLLRDGSGGVRGFLKIGQDLTPRRRMEEALRELNETLERRVEERTAELRQEEERFRTLVETSALTVWTTDAAGVVVEDSPSWRAFTGQTLVEWLGEGWTDVVHPDDREFAARNWRDSVEARTPVDTEFRLWHAPSATWRWTNVRAAPLYGADDGVRGWIGMNIDIDERRRAEEARSEALRQLVTVEEEERHRISRELHDTLGQLLTGLILGLKALERDSDSQRPRIEELERLADRIAREMHEMAVALRPPVLDTLGLAPALRGLLEEWSHRYGIACDFHSTGLEGGRFPPEVEATLYRVVQEGLTNVLKHAGATQVSLVLEWRRGVLSAILEDDGPGFDVESVLASPEKAKRLGVRGMRERVALLGGELEIESSPGSGTTLFVRLPNPGPKGRAVSETVAPGGAGA